MLNDQLQNEVELSEDQQDKMAMVLLGSVFGFVMFCAAVAQAAGPALA